jgi:hypothetical protein
MSHHDPLATELGNPLDRFLASPPMARLHAGDAGVAHGASHMIAAAFAAVD